VVVVTANGPDGQPVGMAVGSFASVSLDPQLVGFLADRSSTSFPLIQAAGSFCANVLAAHQRELCVRFATRSDDKFTGVTWARSPSGAPLLADTVAWIDCDLHDVIEVGDHKLALGSVRQLGTSSHGVAPLVYLRGEYGEFASVII
jgi:flavin reductase (DIM6/NTAB) family NADH-FMN oxidoreductase RutF